MNFDVFRTRISSRTSSIICGVTLFRIETIPNNVPHSHKIAEVLEGGALVFFHTRFLMLFCVDNCLAVGYSGVTLQSSGK